MTLSPSLRAGFYAHPFVRGRWNVDPTFSRDTLEPEIRPLYDGLVKLAAHDDPKHRQTGLEGNVMSRGISSVVETYTFDFLEIGNLWFADGVAQLMEPYVLYFRGEGRLVDETVPDPTKNRPFSYDVVYKTNSAGERYFAGIKTPGSTIPAAFLREQQQPWFAQDQGLKPIPGRVRLGFRKPIYWRVSTTNVTDLPAIGTGLGHGLDYTQWLSMWALATYLMAQVRGLPRVTVGGMPFEDLYREMREVLFEQWEMITFRGTPFYEEHGVFRLGSTICHSLLSTANAHAYTNVLHKLETGQEHPLHARAAATLYGWWFEDVYRVKAPNGYDIVQWPHHVARAQSVFYGQRINRGQGPHLSRYNRDIAPELLKAHYLGAPGFDAAFMGAAANLVSQTIYHPLTKRSGKTVGRMSFQIDGAGRFTDGTPFSTLLTPSKTIVDSETSPVAERTIFRRDVGGLLVAFDPTPDGENLHRYTEYADAFIAERSELATSRHEIAPAYAVSALYTELRARSKGAA